MTLGCGVICPVIVRCQYDPPTKSFILKSPYDSLNKGVKSVGADAGVRAAPVITAELEGNALAENRRDFDQLVAERSLQAMIAWMAPFEGKFYAIGYLMMFMKLITDPNLKKSELALFLENTAKVSRSTADRYISDAAEAGHITIKNPKDRPGLEINIAPDILEHFKQVFRESGKNSEAMAEIYREASPQAAAD